MAPLLRIFLTGLFISFVGSLPLGTLNIAAMQIGISNGVSAALQFAAGALLVEMVYVRISLVGMDWVRKQEKLLRALDWLTLVIMLVLATASFYAALQQKPSGNPILNATLPPLVLGLFMSAVNPVQIPFWFGWSTVLFSKGILQPRNQQYNIYIAGIGFGTLFGNAVFIFGGRLLADAIHSRQHLLNWAIGAVFLATAALQWIKIARKKGAVHQVHHPEESVGDAAELIDQTS